MITFNNQREQKEKKNLKQLHQLKVEFLKIQKINNLKQRCKKNKIKKSTKKLRERNNLFCEEKLCIEIQNKIYNKRIRIRRNKINEDKGKDEE